MDLLKKRKVLSLAEAVVGWGWVFSAFIAAALIAWALFAGGSWQFAAAAVFVSVCLKSVGRFVSMKEMALRQRLQRKSEFELDLISRGLSDDEIARAVEDAERRRLF